MKSTNVVGMSCRPNANAAFVDLSLRDEAGREHIFTFHSSAIGEMSLRLATAGELAAQNRGELTTLDGRPIVRALMPRKYGIRLPEEEGTVVFLTLFPPEMYPLDFAFSPMDADKLGLGLRKVAKQVLAARKRKKS